MKKENEEKVKQFVDYLISENIPFGLTITDDDSFVKTDEWSYRRPIKYPKMSVGLGSLGKSFPKPVEDEND